MATLDIDLAALVDGVVSVLLAVPQLVHLLRNRRVEGLSPAGWVSGSLSCLAWLVYFAIAGRPVLFAAQVAGALPWIAATVALIVLGGRSPARGWVTTVVWGLLLTVAICLAGLGRPDLFHLILAFSPVLAYGPSLVRAWTAPDVSGLSRGTWALGIVEAVSTGMAGWGLWPAVIYGVTGATLSAGMLVRAMTGPREATPVAVPI